MEEKEILFALQRHYKNADECQLSLDISTYEPIPDEFFNDLADLIKYHIQKIGSESYFQSRLKEVMPRKEEIDDVAFGKFKYKVGTGDLETDAENDAVTVMNQTAFQMGAEWLRDKLLNTK